MAPSPTLQAWLSSVGGPESLTSAQAQKWLGTWVCLQNATDAAARYARGPTVARPRVSRATAAGRVVHKATHPPTVLTTNIGEPLPSKVAAGKALIETRGEIWFSRGDTVEDASLFLQAYCHGRRHGVPIKIPITLTMLRGCVLRACGSAPGVDGTPYEAYHLHRPFFAAILGQVFLCLSENQRNDPRGFLASSLDVVLGPSIDLLVWIPKTAWDHRVTQQRLLQLPNCMRRLFGSACAHLLAPAIEPSLEPGQAAIAGGDCYRNIAAAHRHLASLEDEDGPPLRTPHSPWLVKLLLGPAETAVISFCTMRQRTAHPSIRRVPACLLLDQAKAFEMMSHSWLQALLEYRRLPQWAINAFLVSVEGRRLRDQLRDGWISPVLLRGAGMGGPLSPLTWNVNFDPIIWATQLATCCEVLGYVDDLLANVVGQGNSSSLI